MSLLERLLIAVIAILLVAALVGLVKFDIERTGAPVSQKGTALWSWG